MMEDEIVINVRVNSKYTVVFTKSGKLWANRYGEYWRDCLGDGLILAMAQEIEDLRDMLVDESIATMRIY